MIIMHMRQKRNRGKQIRVMFMSTCTFGRSGRERTDSEREREKYNLFLLLKNEKK